MSNTIETQQALSKDARLRGHKPEALVVTVDGSTRLLTSWPWFDDEGDNQVALIMARTDPNDPNTNRRMRYFTIMKKIGEQRLSAPEE